MVRAQHTDLQQLRDHGRPRPYAQLCENSAQVGANGPRTYVEHVCDDFVGMSLGDHSYDLLLSRAEANTSGAGLRHSHQQIARAVDLRIDKNLLGGVVVSILGRLCRTDSFDELRKRAHDFVSGRVGGLGREVYLDQRWAVAHRDLSNCKAGGFPAAMHSAVDPIHLPGKTRGSAASSRTELKCSHWFDGILRTEETYNFERSGNSRLFMCSPYLLPGIV